MDIAGIIIAIITTAGTVLGGQWVWRYFMKKDDNKTAIDQAASAHDNEMDKARFHADQADATKTEKILAGQLKNLEEKLQKHEERITHLEQERSTFILKISTLEKELEIEKLKTERLNKTLDAAEKMLIENGVDNQIVTLIKAMR